MDLAEQVAPEPPSAHPSGEEDPTGSVTLDPPQPEQVAPEPSEGQQATPRPQHSPARSEGPTHSGGETSDDAFYSSSENEESAQHRQLLTTMRNFTEPRAPLLRAITGRIGEGDIVSGGAIAAFYSRRATARERENHRIEDGHRLVYERFDESNILDRRVNEGKTLNFYLIEKSLTRRN